MFVKSNFTPDLTGKHTLSQFRQVRLLILHQSFAKSMLNLAQALLIPFAVFSGLAGSPENLAQMGIYLGPNHA
jgi:hypothetical protein